METTSEPEKRMIKIIHIERRETEEGGNCDSFKGGLGGSKGGFYEKALMEEISKAWRARFWAVGQGVLVKRGCLASLEK